jgi:hypothetical protein
MESYTDAAGDTDTKPCVDCGGSWEGFRYSAGTGRTTGIAREIAKAQPVTKWVATGKEPYQQRSGNGLWSWFSISEPMVPNTFPHLLQPNAIPHFLADCMIGGTGHVGRDLVYSTRELALDALSDAIGNRAKGECK